jgi:hypothetical protein
MFFLYLLLHEIPTETYDPETKVQYGLPLLLHVSGEVFKTAVEMLIVAIKVFVIVGNFFPSFSLSPAKDALAEYMLGVFLTTIPFICMLIATLIYCGLLNERRHID